MKKQVSFDSVDGILDTDKFVSAASGQNHADSNNEYDCSEVSTETELRLLAKTEFSFSNSNSRSYQRDLMEFYKEKEAKGERTPSPRIPILATLEVIPPKPGTNRLSRKDKQSGWSLPGTCKLMYICSHQTYNCFTDKSRSQSRTSKALERFFYNLTRPTDQRNQPIPKKIPHGLGLPAHMAPAFESSKKGKMKVLN